MTDLAETHEAIEALARAIYISQIQLAGLILGACPGPHRIVQHRDPWVFWCETCRYTTVGDRVPP